MARTLSLQEYLLPEFFAEAPREWDRRLREISPVSDVLSHLRFRYRSPSPDWLHPTQGVWEIYSCTPRASVPKERAEQFRLHWSELPLNQQRGRRAVVSNYQHFMWHHWGVEARRFWVLQGAWGGTPAAYTRREERYLDASSCVSEPFPLGFFPPCAFTERSVALILQRDRLLTADKSITNLEQMDRPDVLKAEDEAAERVHRETFLDTMFVMNQPAAEFMKSQLGKAAMADLDLPPAPDTAGSDAWKQHFVEHGTVPGAGLPNSRSLQVAVR